MKIFILVVFLIDLMAIYKVARDNQFLLDNEKIKYIIFILILPIIGALYSMNKVGFRWFSFSFLSSSSTIGYGGGMDGCDSYSDCGGSDGGGGD